MVNEGAGKTGQGFRHIGVSYVDPEGCSRSNVRSHGYRS